MGRGWLRRVVAPQPRVGGGGGTDATRVLVWRRGKRCRGKCDGDEVVKGNAMGTRSSRGLRIQFRE